MATIRIDAGKVNKMHGLINDVKKSAADYKSELEGVKKQVLAINRSVCDLDEVLDELRISSDLQDAKMEFCDALTNDIDGFVEEAVRIDREVAARISRRADEFYEEYPWLRPDCRKSGWERFINSFKEAEEWCLDRWKETGLAARRQMAAVLAAVNQGPGQGVTGMAVALPYLVSQFLAENTADAAAWAVKLYQEKKTVRTGVNAAGATYLAVTAPVFAGVLATAEATALRVFDVKNGRGKKKEEQTGTFAGAGFSEEETKELSLIEGELQKEKAKSVESQDTDKINRLQEQVVDILGQYYPVAVIGGVRYVDYSEQVNAMLEGNRAECVAEIIKNSITVPRGTMSNVPPILDSRALLFFYFKVAPGYSWDFKEKHIWEKAIPNAAYLGVDYIRFAVNGETFSSADIGNLNYGYTGMMLYISADLLLLEGGVAQLKKDKDYNLFKAHVEALKLGEKHQYGEEKDDYEYIKKGMEWAMKNP